MSENKSLRDKISKKLRYSENKILQKIGRKIKKPKPLPAYEKYFKSFKFEKTNIKAKIEKNAKFENKKITKDLIIKNYEENVYNKIVKCLRKFAKIRINVGEQYNKLAPNQIRICENLIDDNVKNNRDAAANDYLNDKNRGNSIYTPDYVIRNKIFFDQRNAIMNEFSKDIAALEPDNTYFSSSNFENMYKGFTNAKETVVKSYSSTENVINGKTIEENNKKIEKAFNEEYNKIAIECNKYINYLENFQKKYKIEHDASLKVSFKGRS